MIILQDYWMGRDVTYPLALTPEIKRNAITTVALANALLAVFGQGRKVNSGWRPPQVNAATAGASATSLHMTGQAIDLEDRNGELDDWLMSVDGEASLIAIGLWHEHPSSTKGADGGDGWCHIQTKPPRSGNRHFYR
jgi:hypothetical protein